MDVRSRRQAGLTALYLGIFATIWFSVPAADPPLRTLLVVGAVAALLTAMVGAVIVVRSRGVQTGPRDRGADPRYVIIVAVEFAVAVLGAVVLAALGWREFVPVLICAVVGVHFFPLAPVLGDRMLVPLGVAMCLVALAGLVTALTSTISAGLVVGTGAGVLLLGYAVMALVRELRRS